MLIAGAKVNIYFLVVAMVDFGYLVQYQAPGSGFDGSNSRDFIYLVQC